MKKKTLLLFLILALLFPAAAHADTDDIPAFDGRLVIELQDNTPAFSADDIATEDFFRYSELDSLGRTGPAMACLSRASLPTELRGENAVDEPSGWETARYDDLIEGQYLYKRCRLIACELGGADAEARNLLTGTRCFSAQGMGPVESRVAEYITRTKNHVLYRVTPIYRGDDLVASGVQMEGWSVEDSGRTVCFNVFVYNVQPGIAIDYGSGRSRQDPEVVLAEAEEEEEPVLPDTALPTFDDLIKKAQKAVSMTQYVLDTDKMKFHYPDCAGAQEISEEYKKTYTGIRMHVIEMGYSPCDICNP